MSTTHVCMVLITSLMLSLPRHVAIADESAAEWEALKDHRVPQWFDNAKFGIFIHWGPYSVMGYHPRGRGYAEHAPKQIHRDPKNHLTSILSLTLVQTSGGCHTY